MTWVSLGVTLVTDKIEFVFCVKRVWQAKLCLEWH
jgi:hypothetical protein